MQRVKLKEMSVSALVFYILGFLLFWEWLRPLTYFTDTNYISVFAYFAAFLFLLAYLGIKFWWGFPVKLIALLFSIHAIFFPGSFLNIEWFIYFINDLRQNSTYLFNGQWFQLSSITRSFLFLILLWLISYLMHYWLIQSRRIFLFFLITILYITVIDTFTPYDATFAIIRTVMVGFILLGALRFVRIIESEGFSLKKGRFPIMWIFPLILIISFSSLLGFLAPKADPQWPDPVPFIKAVGSDGEGEEGFSFLPAVRRIGYGVDDSQLGGPFLMDEGVVFTAKVKEIQYWKIETRDIYTGKGWESTESDKLQAFDHTNINFRSPTLDSYTDSVQQIEYKAEVSLNDGINFPFIMMPGELKSISAIEGIEYKINPNTGKVSPFKDGNLLSVETYETAYTYPKFSIEELRRAGTNYPNEITQSYLQLPESLPQDVVDLAVELTSDKENTFDKAKAIEAHFMNNEFEYETNDVAIPTEDEDYVAQFLFETQKGYCDNFSTSMVVLLRSVGIPARWVKGFTPGDYKESTMDFERIYEIKNANAHSWVEVYFPGSGWVPFEPTKGFVNPFNFVNSYQGFANTDNETKETETDVVEPEEETVEEEDVEDAFTSVNSETDSFLNVGVKISLIVVSFLLVLILLAYLTRKKWIGKVYLYFYLKKRNDTSFYAAYKRLLWLLRIYGMERLPNQTLREYAQYIDQTLEMTSMIELTLMYERAQYGRDDKVSWNESQNILENIIRKLPS